MTPYWTDGQVSLYLGDCLDVLAGMETASADAIVTDPPAAVSFMGREWDSDMGGRAQWVAWLSERMAQAVRVLKPGGHALVWSLPRTAHWTAWALEDAGLQIRDCIPHLFGSGFPKSLDVSRAIDRAAGAEREVVGPSKRHVSGKSGQRTAGLNGSSTFAEKVGMGGVITAPATEDAARWDGWGTALKPGQEIWWLARKPIRGTIAASVLEHGTGALNIAGCRVGSTVETWPRSRSFAPGISSGYTAGIAKGATQETGDVPAGRWPPNLVLTHSAACGTQCAGDCPVGELDRQSGVLHKQDPGTRNGRRSGGWSPAGTDRPLVSRKPNPSGGLDEAGTGASRFYPVFRYQAKAPAAERPRLDDGTAHPTVKPLGLMCWLARLITPPGGTILDLFAGTGVTAEAAIIEGFRCILIEADPASAELIRIRLRKDIQPAMFAL